MRTGAFEKRSGKNFVFSFGEIYQLAMVRDKRQFSDSFLVSKLFICFRTLNHEDTIFYYLVRMEFSDESFGFLNTITVIEFLENFIFPKEISGVSRIERKLNSFSKNIIQCFHHNTSSGTNEMETIKYSAVIGEK